MVLMCWDFIDFNKTRLSAAGWTTDDAKGEEEEDNRVVNIKIAFFSVVLGGKRVVSCAFCRRARVICLLCSEEERESIPMQHTGRAFNPCYLKYEKEKEEFYRLAFGRERNQRREKREPTRETPQNTFVYRGGGLFFCPSSLCSSSYVVVV